MHHMIKYKTTAITIPVVVHVIFGFANGSILGCQKIHLNSLAEQIKTKKEIFTFAYLNAFGFSCFGSKSKRWLIFYVLSSSFFDSAHSLTKLMKSIFIWINKNEKKKLFSYESIEWFFSLYLLTTVPSSWDLIVLRFCSFAILLRSLSLADRVNKNIEEEY